MNLIEQLGGYEKASKFCDKEIKEGGYPYGLIGDLLEYRRANNIFEVGDLVVLTESLYSSAIWGIHQVNKDLVAISKDFGFIPIYKSDIRHATPQEIEAGNRL